MTTKTTNSTRKIAAQKPAPKTRGNMKPTEIKPLILAARKAFDFQDKMGNHDAGETFDSWRAKQCQAAVGKPGLTSCDHEDFRPLLSHFQHLAGDDGAAFANAMKGGNPTDHAAQGDTHEARRQRVHLIADLLARHAHLAATTVDQLVAEGADEWYRETPDQPYPGPTSQWLRDIRARKAAIDAHGRGPITVGYLTFLVRAKTKRPDLHLGHDWQAGLAERCTRRQIDEIFYTIQNRINATEGVGSAKTRNKSQRSPAAKAARDPHDIAPRF